MKKNAKTNLHHTQHKAETNSISALTFGAVCGRGIRLWASRGVLRARGIHTKMIGTRVSLHSWPAAAVVDGLVDCAALKVVPWYNSATVNVHGKLVFRRRTLQAAQRGVRGSERVGIPSTFSCKLLFIGTRQNGCCWPCATRAGHWKARWADLSKSVFVWLCYVARVAPDYA